MSLPLISANGLVIPRGKKWVVALGSCAGCSIQTFDPNRLRLDEAPVVFLVEGDPTSLLARLPKAALVVTDVDGSHWLSKSPGEVPDEIKK